VKELQDYSGEFKPDLKMTDFSKDALIRLWNVGGKLMITLGGIWYSIAKERFGDQVAVELDGEAWQKLTKPNFERVAKAMNIKGNDVATVFKVLQCDPGGSPISEMDFDLKDKNHGILTIPRCRPLEAAERDGDIVRMKSGCDACTKYFPRWAHFVNPDMNVIPLKLPPRKSQDEVACRWEWKVKEKA
jgi:hypothetical protein